MANYAKWGSDSTSALTWITMGETSANFNSLANGSCISSSGIINTSAGTLSNLDEYLTHSFSFYAGAATTTGSSYLNAYLLPLNYDGTTYGDNSIAANTTSAVTPHWRYYVGQIGWGFAVATGTLCRGTFPPIVIPPLQFIMVLQNNLGNALSAAASGTWDYMFYSENLNA